MASLAIAVAMSGGGVGSCLFWIDSFPENKLRILEMAAWDAARKIIRAMRQLRITDRRRAVARMIDILCSFPER
jgi:hypothetical protein